MNSTTLLLQPTLWSKVVLHQSARSQNHSCSVYFTLFIFFKATVKIRDISGDSSSQRQVTQNRDCPQKLITRGHLSNTLISCAQINCWTLYTSLMRCQRQNLSACQADRPHTCCRLSWLAEQETSQFWLMCIFPLARGITYSDQIQHCFKHSKFVQQCQSHANPNYHVRQLSRLAEWFSAAGPLSGFSEQHAVHNHRPPK